MSVNMKIYRKRIQVRRRSCVEETGTGTGRMGVEQGEEKRKDSWDKGGGRREKKRERGSSAILYMSGRAQGKQGISQKMHSHRGRRGEGEKSELMEKDEKGRD